MCKNDSGVVVTKPEVQQSVITTISSNNKILANSLNKLNDKGTLFEYFVFIICIVLKKIIFL